MPSVLLRSHSLNFDVRLDFLPSGSFLLMDGNITENGNFLIYAQFRDQNFQMLPFHIEEAQVAGQVINIHDTLLQMETIISSECFWLNCQANLN